MVCASPATSISLSCRFTTSTEPSTVTMKPTGSNHQPYGATAENSSSTTTRPSAEPRSEPKTDQSASSPASQVPTTMPTPNASRNHGTALSDRPPTSVTVGAM